MAKATSFEVYHKTKSYLTPTLLNMMSRNKAHLQRLKRPFRKMTKLVNKVEQVMISYLSSVAGRANRGDSQELFSADERRVHEANHATARRKANQILWRDILLDLDQVTNEAAVPHSPPL